MIRINLLPYRAARRKANIRIQINIFLVSVTLCLGLIFFYNAYLNSRLDRFKGDLTHTKTQIEKYEQINQEIARIKQKLQLVDRKINIIESLEHDRHALVQNLDILAQLVIEKSMWYTQIEEKDNAIQLCGIAIDNQTVAAYMTNLEKSEQFENVRLVTLKQHKLQGKESKAMNFQLFNVNFDKQ